MADDYPEEPPEIAARPDRPVGGEEQATDGGTITLVTAPDGQQLVTWVSFDWAQRKLEAWAAKLDMSVTYLRGINVKPGYFTAAHAYRDAVHHGWRDPSIEGLSLLGEAFRAFGQALLVAKDGYTENEKALTELNLAAITDLPGSVPIVTLDGAEPVEGGEGFTVGGDWEEPEEEEPEGDDDIPRNTAGWD